MGRPKNAATISTYRFREVMRLAGEYLVSEDDPSVHINVSTPPKLARHCAEFCGKHKKDEEGRQLVPVSERTIRRNLSEGRMDPRTLDVIARAINVDPCLLGGGCEAMYRLLSDPKDKDDWERLYAHPKYHPYMKYEDLGIDYMDCLLKVLKAHGVSESDYKALSWWEARSLMGSLDRAVTWVLQGCGGKTHRFINAQANILLKELDSEEQYKNLNARDALEFLNELREDGGFSMPADEEITRTPYVPNR